MDYKDKLYQLIKMLSERHLDFFYDKSKEEIDLLIENSLQKFKLENDYDFLYISNYLIKHIIGDIDDHTKVTNPDETLFYPLKLKFINNELFIIDCPDNMQEHKYKKIEKINGIDINQIINEISESTCYLTDNWLYSMIEYKLSNNVDIKSLPSVNPNDDIVFNVEGCDVNISKICEPKKEKNEYDSPISYNVDADIMKIDYRICKENYEGQISDIIKEIENTTKELNISKFIIDLRENTGGVSWLINPLIDVLKDKEIITLCDRGTFSGGFFACETMRKLGSKFVGETPGGTYNFFADCPPFKLDKFNVYCSTKYFYYHPFDDRIVSANNTEELDEIKDNPEFFKRKNFDIDVYVEQTIEDYINQADRILETSKDILRGSNKKI